MATLHDRGIEDRMMRCLTAMWENSGETTTTIAARIGVSHVTVWQWTVGGTFPNSLARLRRLVEASGATIVFTIAKDEEEWKF